MTPKLRYKSCTAQILSMDGRRSRAGEAPNEERTKKIRAKRAQPIQIASFEV
jgi:hypothetical protein